MRAAGLFRPEPKQPPPIGQVPLKEWVFPLLLAGLLIGLVGIPYWDAYSRQSASERFMGLVGSDAIDDNNVYLGLMRQAAEGKVLFTNNFTPEPNPPALFNFLYLALGRLSAWTGWTLDFTHRLFGAVSIVLLVLAAYSFIATGIRRPFYRRFALLLACFGGGLLWFCRIVLRATGFDLRPVSNWLVELNLFHAMIVYPHFIFAAALMTGSLALLLKSERVRRFGPALAAGCCAAALASSHAFEAVAFVPIAGMYLLLDGLGRGSFPGWNRLKSVAIVLGLPLVVLLLNRLILAREPRWGDVVSRLNFPTPEPFRLGMGLGASFLIALLTFDGFLRMRRPSGERLAKAWVLTVLILAYVPYINWRWHLLNGIQIPLAVLAVQGLRRTVFRRILLKRRARKRVPCRPRSIWAPPGLVTAMGVILLACCLSTANIFLSYRQDARLVSGPAFLPTTELAAMDWMNRQLPREALILASYTTGNYVPRLTGQRVFIGEDMLTNALPERQRDIRLFYLRDWDDSNRVGLLRRFGIGYVYYGPVERSLGSYNPEGAPFLTRVYDAGGIQIFEVKDQGTAGAQPTAPVVSGGGMP
jgi:hypothetical protein